MPKYFKDERALPFQKVELRGAAVTVELLNEVFSKGKKEVSICVVHDDFEASCLGYVFNVSVRGRKYVLLDIVGREVMTAENLGDLNDVMNHVIGSKYNQVWQSVFQKRRNEIGIGIKPEAVDPEEND